MILTTLFIVINKTNHKQFGTENPNIVIDETTINLCPWYDLLLNINYIAVNIPLLVSTDSYYELL